LITKKANSNMFFLQLITSHDYALSLSSLLTTRDLKI
jgi:hypothetical protein